MAAIAPAAVPQALADSLSVEKVRALLLDRFPEDLREGQPAHALYRDTVLGAAIEVSSLAGLDTETHRWALAQRATALGAALDIEAATFPVQTGLEETGLLKSLRARYTSVLGQLNDRLAGDATDQSEPGDPPRPRGSFPVAQSYPDPALSWPSRRWS